MEHLSIIKIFLNLIWKVSPSYYFYLIGKTISDSLIVLINIWLPKILIDLLLSGKPIGESVKTLIIFGIIKSILSFLNKVFLGKLAMEERLLSKGILYKFSEKAFRLEYAALENSEILDLRERALFAVNNYGALYGLMQELQTILTQIFILIGVGGVLISFSSTYVLVIVIFIALSILNSRITSKKSFQGMQEIIPINRKYGYYINTSTEDKNQKDYRLYNMSDMLSETIYNLSLDTKEWMKGIYKIEAKSAIFESVLNYTLTFISYFYISARALTDGFGPRISLGDFLININATEKFFKAFQDLGRSLAHLIQTVDTLRPFKEFMEVKENDDIFGKEKVEKFQSLTFKNVSFTYPNSNKKILEDICFTINKGEKISIVGVNNAGKTTIIKLICGFFKPDEGEILLNGKNIREYDHKQYMHILAAVFQDFKLFPFTIGENIEGNEKDPKKLDKVLDKVGIKEVIDRLPKREDSYLEKSIYENAVDLSGGEKQKLAISRALYKDSKLVILDEPTSALDPLAESEIYENFNSLVEDKTAIYISHRMSSSLFCDKILLLDGGKIRAFDSHHNLMKEDNIYRKLFLAQAENFI